MRLSLFPLLLAGSLAFAGCDSDSGSNPSDTARAQLVADVAADPAGLRDNNGNVLPGTGRFTFYSLRENRIVPNADSATTKWDLAFRNTVILTNSASSGPGQGGARVVEGVFEEFAEVPADLVFATDTTATRRAITARSNTPTLNPNGWYNYISAQNVVLPVPGRVIFVRTADGKYAKVRILSFYKGNPATPDASSATSPARYYTFEYVLQTDGSRRFE